MTSPYLLRPTQSVPSAIDVADVSPWTLFTSPSLFELVRWIEAHDTNQPALVERTDHGWSVCLIEDDTPPSPATVRQAADPHGRVKRPRRRRV